mgnify:CR=1 FL=1
MPALLDYRMPPGLRIVFWAPAYVFPAFFWEPANVFPAFDAYFSSHLAGFTDFFAFDFMVNLLRAAPYHNHVNNTRQHDFPGRVDIELERRRCDRGIDG